MLTLVLITLGLATATPFSNSLSKNDTYVDYGSSLALGVQAWGTNWTESTHTDTSSFTVNVNGPTTNMTSVSDSCCIYLTDYSLTNFILVVNRTGTNVQNISTPSYLGNPNGIWVNASGVPVTDFWVVSSTNKFLLHLNATGSWSTDATGNFSVAASNAAPTGVTSNVTNSVPKVFFIANDNGNKILEYSSTGTNTYNITLTGAVAGIQAAMNNSASSVGNVFWVAYHNVANLFLYNYTGSIIANYSSVASDCTSLNGVALLQRNSNPIDGFVYDRTTDEICWVIHNPVSNVTLVTNQTGAWSNTSRSNEGVLTGNNLGGNKNYNFTWNYTGQRCSWEIGYRMLITDAHGNQNFSSSNTFFYIPYVNYSSYDSGNFTATSCDNATHISETTADIPAGRFDIIMGKTANTANFTCAYNVTPATRMVAYNYSDYCYLQVNHTSLPSGSTITAYSWLGISEVKPSNLPTALAGIALVSVTMIYVIVKKSKRISWS